MIVLKACTRCGGDMLYEQNVGLPDLVCLQCGYRVTMTPALEDRVRRHVRPRRSARRLAGAR